MEIVAGGRPTGKGFHYEPTVIAGALQSDPIVTQEVFGPVISVTRFGDDDPVIDWTGRAISAAAALRYRATWVNTHLMICSEMPHGGFEQSGYGKDLSVYALHDYTVPRHIMLAH